MTVYEERERERERQKDGERVEKREGTTGALARGSGN
jgi:hypothetical protein